MCGFSYVYWIWESPGGCHGRQMPHGRQRSRIPCPMAALIGSSTCCDPCLCPIISSVLFDSFPEDAPAGPSKLWGPDFISLSREDTCFLPPFPAALRGSWWWLYLPGRVRLQGLGGAPPSPQNGITRPGPPCRPVLCRLSRPSTPCQRWGTSIPGGRDLGESPPTLHFCPPRGLCGWNAPLPTCCPCRWHSDAVCNQRKLQLLSLLALEGILQTQQEQPPRQRTASAPPDPARRPRQTGGCAFAFGCSAREGTREVRPALPLLSGLRGLFPSPEPQVAPVLVLGHGAAGFSWGHWALRSPLHLYNMDSDQRMGLGAGVCPHRFT